MSHALYFVGASGSSVKEYSPQRHRVEFRNSNCGLRISPTRRTQRHGGEISELIFTTKGTKERRILPQRHRVRRVRRIFKQKLFTPRPQRLRGESHGSAKFHFAKRVGLVALTAIVFPRRRPCANQDDDGVFVNRPDGNRRLDGEGKRRFRQIWDSSRYSSHYLRSGSCAGSDRRGSARGQRGQQRGD